MSTLKCCKCLFDGYSIYLCIVFSKFFTGDYYCLLFYATLKANALLPLFLRLQHLLPLTQSCDHQIPHVAWSPCLVIPCTRHVQGVWQGSDIPDINIYNYTDIIIKKTSGSWTLVCSDFSLGQTDFELRGWEQRPSCWSVPHSRSLHPSWMILEMGDRMVVIWQYVRRFGLQPQSPSWWLWFS